MKMYEIVWNLNAQIVKEIETKKKELLKMEQP